MDTRVASVEKGGPAHRAGIRPGDELVSINGEPIRDFIDLQYLTAGETVGIRIRRRGREREAAIGKAEGEPLGLILDREMYPPERRCVNRCVFCFVDQLPPGMRPSLYVKDDDWRYSALHGNYITLTNVGAQDMDRIIARKVSPLYVSVHSTDGALRARMMGNPAASAIMEQLAGLARGGIVFHCQVVLCPGINDGASLERTLGDLYGLHPWARSVAVVPVGLTAFRGGLPELRPVEAADARRAVAQVEAFAQRCARRTGERFAYAADEMYGRAGLPWPEYADGFHAPQAGNGVGLMSDFISGFRDAMERMPSETPARRSAAVVTGVSAGAALTTLCHELCGRVAGLEVRVLTVGNRLFGHSVTVAGLLGGEDILEAAKGAAYDVLYIPECSLRTGDESFLDGKTRDWLEKELRVPVVPVPADGYAFARRLAGLPDESEEP